MDVKLIFFITYNNRHYTDMSFPYSTTFMMSTDEVNYEPAILGFSPKFIHSQKKYYLPDPGSPNPNKIQLTPYCTDSWKTLTVWNVPDDEYYVQVAYKIFSNIGEISHIERIYMDDDMTEEAPIAVTFTNWNINHFTSKFAEELTVSSLYNKDVSPYDKSYTTVFYDFEDGTGEQEFYVEM
jgi:hypothetical protein